MLLCTFMVRSESTLGIEVGQAEGADAEMECRLSFRGETKWEKVFGFTCFVLNTENMYALKHNIN